MPRSIVLMKSRKVPGCLIFCMVISMLAMLGCSGRADWPPQFQQEFPDIEFMDQTGKPVHLRQFKGSVILVEYIGLTCPACQAFSGANETGSFGGVIPQKNLPSIASLIPTYAKGLTFSDSRFVFVQILLYDMKLEVPDMQAAQQWAAHFKLDRNQNRIVLAGRQDLQSQASYNLIPGFQLFDRNLTLVSDSTGHQPRHDLYQHLFPLMANLVK